MSPLVNGALTVVAAMTVGAGAVSTGALSTAFLAVAIACAAVPVGRYVTHLGPDDPWASLRKRRRGGR
jgi:hypothetical protein